MFCLLTLSDGTSSSGGDLNLIMNTHTLDLALALFVNVRPHWWFKAVTFNSPGSSMNNESVPSSSSSSSSSSSPYMSHLLEFDTLMRFIDFPLRSHGTCWMAACCHTCLCRVFAFWPDHIDLLITKKEKCTWSSSVHAVSCSSLDGEQVSEWAPLSNIRPRLGRYLCSSSHRLTRCLYNLLFPPALLWLDACHQLPTWTKPGRGKRAAGSACHIPVQALTLFLPSWRFIQALISFFFIREMGGDMTHNS